MTFTNSRAKRPIQQYSDLVGTVVDDSVGVAMVTCRVSVVTAVRRMKQPDPVQRATFPHFGSKFRFAGRTQHQVQGTSDVPDRTLPKINRKASTRFIGAKEQGYNVGSEFSSRAVYTWVKTRYSKT